MASSSFVQRRVLLGRGQLEPPQAGNDPQVGIDHGPGGSGAGLAYLQFAERILITYRLDTANCSSIIFPDGFADGFALQYPAYPNDSQ